MLQSRAALLLASALCSCGVEPGFLEGFAGETTRQVPAEDPLAAVLDDLSRGSAGDGEAVTRAFDRSAELLEADPTPRKQAARGASILLQARDASFFTRLSALDDGTELLDTAIEQAPEDPIIRYLRAVSTFPLPSIAGRSEIATDDLDWLIARADSISDPLFDGPRRALTLCMRGVRAKRDGDGERAETLLRSAIAEAPESPAAARARAELADS